MSEFDAYWSLRKVAKDNWPKGGPRYVLDEQIAHIGKIDNTIQEIRKDLKKFLSSKTTEKKSHLEILIGELERRIKALQEVTDEFKQQLQSNT
jgi:hypothetical protein